MKKILVVLAGFFFAYFRLVSGLIVGKNTPPGSSPLGLVLYSSTAHPLYCNGKIIPDVLVKEFR